MKSGQPLSNVERQEALLRYIRLEKRATVNELSSRFDVSVATVRRDLDALTERGDVARFHGGAMLVRQAPPEAPAHQRSVDQTEAKQRIGAAAASLINDGDTVFLGSGTTVLELARSLHGHHKLTVITNSVLVINELATSASITLISLGGLVRGSEMSMIGHVAEQALAEVRAQKIFIGIHAIDIDDGLTNDYMPETVTDRAILTQGGQVIVLADHSKCGRTSTAFVAPIEAVDTLLVDRDTSPAFVDAVRAAGVQVLVV
jgi:DeoR/GlpR family transcriptional regulator of sugar metabolism